jgi:TatD DNase family protein
MIDTHCHLTHPRLAPDMEGVLARAAEAGVEACMTIGTGVPDARLAREASLLHQGYVHASAGLDPFSAHAAAGAFDDAFDELAELLHSGGFAAVGEIGLDYHYDLDPRPVQIAQLERQLHLAASLDLPVVLHVRDAHEDMAAVLRGHPRNRGVIHSFTGGPAEAERYLASGWHLAFNGVLTFKNAEAVREAARIAPVERILVETDAPYLAPVPHRGERCEPAFVALTLSALARARGAAAAAIEVATTLNARRLFGLGTPPE